MDVRALWLALALLAGAGGSLHAQSLAGRSAEVPDARALFMDAARAAWSFVDRNYEPETGLVRAHDSYRYVTTWDVASGLAALYSARELGLLPADEYDRRMRRALRTLGEMELVDGIAFNRSYDATTGRAVDRKERPTERGTGWSATDLGRLLVWLKIVAANHPQLAGEVGAVVERLDFARLVRGGYLHGGNVEEGSGLEVYPEGRIGYEQYAAAGFSLWGHRAEKALGFRENATPITVLGVPLYGDRRGGDRLTSEPFVAMGLELGWWTPDWRELAWRMLAVQEARWKETGEVTVVSEDAVPVPPYHFYYYNVYHEGREFPVSFHGVDHLDGPRWVSTKAAYGWHTLLPGPYTWLAVRTVAPAVMEGGVDAGVFEGSGEPTGGANVNTAAVVLESALYAMRGRPLLDY